MKIQWYPWLKTIYYRILHSYCINKGHHAMLFSSKWDNGEDRLIEFLARWLICENPINMEYCDVCHHCYLMNIEQYPNYYQLCLQNHAPTINTDLIKICINSIYEHTIYNKVRVVFIKYIEYLNAESVNLLLKIIEEPPINTYFFLKTREYMYIPATIRSRCMRWFILSPPEHIGLKWIKTQEEGGNNDNVSIRTALRLNYGSPILAKFMLKSSDMWNYRLGLYDILKNVCKNKSYLQLLSLLNSKKYMNVSVCWLITVLLDALKYKQGIQEDFFINLDQLKLIYIVSMQWSVFALHEQLKQWLILFHYFQKFDSINHELLLTCRLLHWEQNLVETCSQLWSI
ncbi:DNA polymerase III subunit delta [Candidatus Blochmanniella vafra str. BVAF]|uniref:DNA polymerase III subunit delta n=1 Tax=Blochmanniella vafra (strain BVAF) TaxID=859654 RepID=E8Q6A2_BLOVB|nr:DNA polymerase III subunit delta' C-terminal domain-containing protein [Candidatus Blochmannia vafer]ADV33796.1 DNA polymerase III subunit delta [Candidatus Blochmannia vafer str. BVAF]